MKNIAFLTYDQKPNGSQDDLLTCKALLAHNIVATGAVWNDPQVNWQKWDAIVIRSVWDYFKRINEFRDWLDQIERLGVPVFNSVQTIRWNIEKTYLQELEQRDVEIIPSVFLQKGEPANLAAIMERRGWKQAVVKPTISGTAWHTWLTNPTSVASDQAQLEAGLQERNILIQEYVVEVATHGEWSFMFFDKQFSHVVLKTPLTGDFRVQGGQLQKLTPPNHLLQQAQRVVEQVSQPLLYARVDGIVRDDRLLLMELEVIEPALFFGYSDVAIAMFARAVGRYLSK